MPAALPWRKTTPTAARGWLSLALAAVFSLLAGDPATAADAERPGGPALRFMAASAASAEAVTLDWDDLVPEDWDPLAALGDLALDLDLYEDDDPRAQEILDRILAVWDQAPLVDALDGRRIRLPGFVVPLEGDGDNVTEFLLVPYYGACIHVPPPPANQLVHVLSDVAVPIRGLFDTVWVSGELRVERGRSELGVSGYRLNATRVVPYE